MTLSEKVQALGRDIVAAAPADLATALCAGIAEIVGAGVRIAPRAVTDRSTTTELFAAVVARPSRRMSPLGVRVVRGDLQHGRRDDRRVPPAAYPRFDHVAPLLQHMPPLGLVLSLIVDAA